MPPTPLPPPQAAGWGLKVAMAFGLLADAGVVILLIAISGFVFGGPEGARGEIHAVMGWAGAVATFVVPPALGLWFWRRGRPDVGVALAWLPPLAALAALAFGLL